MLSTDFPQRNFLFGPHEGMSEEECMTLPVYRGHYQDDSPCIISRWQFSKEDLEEIQKTGGMWLCIYGQGMPPVSLFTENLFGPCPEQ